MRVFLSGPRDIKEYQKGCVALSQSVDELPPPRAISISCSHEDGKGEAKGESPGGMGTLNMGFGGLAGWSKRRMTED